MSKTVWAVLSGTTTVRPLAPVIGPSPARMPTTRYVVWPPAPWIVSGAPRVSPSCAASVSVMSALGSVRVGQGRARGEGQVVEARLGRRVDPEDRDRRRQCRARAQFRGEVGAPLEGRRGDRDTGRAGDRRDRLARETGLAEGLDAQVGPADDVADRGVDRGVDPGVGRQTGEEDGDTERDPEGAECGAQWPRAQAAPGQAVEGHRIRDRAGRAAR